MDPSPRPDTAETLVDGQPGGAPPGPAPERIGAYRVEGRLGLGGMGEVLLAWDERLERRVAIKRIRQDAGLTPEQRERFRLEARLAARLSHSAVVQIYDLVSEGAEDAIVMEYVEGRTLADWLASGERLETAEVLRLAGEIAEGLAAAHEAGLVHRDLKAANILVTPSGHAKILDFGLARPVDREPEEGLTRQGVILGTCHAMSPEQARGEEVDERSDLFSFGALIHEMLTGRPPFRGNDAIDSLRRVVTEEPVDPLLARPDLPAEAAHLLRRLLAKRREDRPANAREVIAILESLRIAPSGPHTAALEGSVGGFSNGAETQLELPTPFFPIRRLLPLVAAVVLLALLFGMQAARRPGRAEIRKEDRASCLEIQQRLDKGEEGDLEIELGRIKNIVGSSPGLLDAWLLGARIAHSRFLANREPENLERARDFIKEARKLAPRDPRPLVQELKLFRAAHDVAREEAILARLEPLLPTAELLPLRALVAEDRGDLAAAAALLARAIERAPTWQNRYLLAIVEAKRGRIEEARRQIEEILRDAPGNILALQQLGWWELTYGDPERAARIFEDLTPTAPEYAWSNLGAVRALLQNREGAEDALHRALALHPGHPPVLINLAEIELDLGKNGLAAEHYRQALAHLKTLDTKAGLGLTEQLLEAQCLARLDRTHEAIEIVQALGPKIAGDPSLLYQSALVYGAAGDRAAALDAVETALAQGLPRRWFDDRIFHRLREPPEIRF